MRLTWITLAAVLLALGLLRAAAPPARPAAPRPDRRIDFVKDVQPLLAAFCTDCHGDKKQKGGLRLDSREHAVREGAVVPGRSGESTLVDRVTGHAGERMPPKGPYLSPKQVELLKAWIDQGADWPASAPVAAKGDHWAYRPLTRPPAPAVADRTQVRNAIDAFVQARLDKAGLKPAPEADRRTLIRRLSFDLTGLPPSPEEVRAFADDGAPDAYERLVERLLSSPAYGERWARHWLDVVHFAETHGHDQDVPRENAWPYRDYLVRAFNADKPYGRFVEDQIAGDVLSADEANIVAALGMLAAGPWDESSQQSIRDDTVDKKQAQNLDRDDMLTTVMTAFVSATIHCARCHDHKFDPISQADYYNLQSVFAGVDRANRAYEPDVETARRRADLSRRREALRTASARELLTTENEREAAAWERSRKDDRWHVVAAETVTAANGSVAAKLDDGSIRFAGPRPAADVYTITSTTPLKGVTAVRLEVLTDDSLPHKGPGRQDNGNLHLNEFRVTAGPSDKTAGAAKPVAIASARADFDQQGWGAAKAIDGNPATAWGIYPQVGKSHEIVFAFATPVAHEKGSAFTFRLEQTHGGGHLIGRLRLSLTTGKQARPLPPEVNAALDVDPTKRGEGQRAELIRHVMAERLQSDWAKLPPMAKVYAAAAEFTAEGSFRPAKGCRPVYVLKRGDIAKPEALAKPAALSCVPGLPAALSMKDAGDEGQRRAALARWLSDPRNVLTWRSIVNRLWHHHFGRGLCATPGDLGRMGAVPSHPELIDWLAAEAIESGGSLKRMHRLMVTSAAYRRSSRHDAAAAKADSDNAMLWRMNRARLDAESVRDGVMAVTGALDRAMGGPSVKHFVQTKGIHVTPNVDYAAADVDGPGAHRRSVYRFVFRTLPDPFLEALDCPDASQFAPARTSSVTASQALALLNDRFMVRQAEHFAERLEGEAEGVEARVRRAYELALGRRPSSREEELVAEYARRHGLAAACRVVLNLNEFVFVD